MNITITLSESQAKAFEYITTDVQDWIENVAFNRARIASDEIIQMYVEYKNNNNEPITAVGKDAQVLAAFEEGIVLTAAEQVAQQEALQGGAE